MKRKALVTAELVRPMLDPLADRIDFQFAGYSIDHVVMPRDELKRRVADVDVLVCEYDTIDAEIFDAAKKIKIIVCCLLRSRPPLRAPRRPASAFRPRPQHLPRWRSLQGYPPLRCRNRGVDAETEERVAPAGSLRAPRPWHK